MILAYLHFVKRFCDVTFDSYFVVCLYSPNLRQMPRPRDTVPTNLHRTRCRAVQYYNLHNIVRTHFLSVSLSVSVNTIISSRYHSWIKGTCSHSTTGNTPATQTPGNVLSLGRCRSVWTSLKPVLITGHWPDICWAILSTSHTSTAASPKPCNTIEQLNPTFSHFSFLPTIYEVWGKVMFSQACVILFTGGVSKHVLG